MRVPVKVFSDPGTSGLTMAFNLPENFQIAGFEWGDAYPAADAVEWNADALTAVWADPNGTVTVAADGAVVLYLTVTIPEDATTKTQYPVTFDKANLSASGETGIEHNCSKSLDGWIMPISNGDVVFAVGNAAGSPGEAVQIPVSIIYDNGSAFFEYEVALPLNMTIESIAFDPDYEANGTFAQDGNKVTWTRNADSTFVGDSTHVIFTITSTIPADAEYNDYPMTLTNVFAKNGEGNDMAYDVVDGVLTVKEPLVTFLVNNFEISYTEPGRENYWSHDTRKFGDGSNGTNDGLAGLKATATIYYYAVNEKNNHFVDADGNELTDVNGNVLVYDAAAEKLPVSKDMAIRVEENIDLTPYVRAKFAEVKHPTALDADGNAVMLTLDSPAGIWVNEANALIAAGQGTDLSNVHPKNDYEIEFYYYQDENSEIKLGNGTDPVLMGTKKIYIGVKGDINLDNAISIEDAYKILNYHVSEHQTYMYYQLNEDPVLDRRPTEDSNEQGLPFYLGNVCYVGDAEPFLDLRDCKAVLDYFVLGQALLEQSWEATAGYDFPDEFYPGY